MFTFIEEIPVLFQQYGFNIVSGLFATIMTSILNNINLRVCLFQKTTCKNNFLINNLKVLIIIKNNKKNRMFKFYKIQQTFYYCRGLISQLLQLNINDYQ